MKNLLVTFTALCACLAWGCGTLHQPVSQSQETVIDQMPFSGTQPNGLRFQSPDGLSDFASQKPDEARQAQQQVVDVTNIVLDVEIRGNTTIPTHHLLRNVRTRPGRYFDPDLLQQDVNELWKMKEVQRVIGPYVNRTDQGVVVSIEIVERQLMESVKFIGNRAVTDRALLKETGLNDGQPMDIHEIKLVKHRIEEFYQEKGFPNTQVEILEGNQNLDNSAVFLIHEDEQQRVWNVEFEGNSIATDGRLQSLIESKPGILKVVGGLVKRQEIEQDVLRLTSYYRGLGFFNARIGREVIEHNSGRWITLRFVIDEGPRYKIRNVSFIGNKVFNRDQLLQMIELKPQDAMPEYNTSKKSQDLVSLRDLYGANGFVHSNVEVETRFLEEPGSLDLVYKIKEGEQYRIRNINIHIEGGSGVTRREVALNRLTFQPGDIIDLREIRNSERSLARSQVFSTGQGDGGAAPKIAVVPEGQEGSASRTPRSRTSRSRRSTAGSGSRSPGGSQRR